MPRTQHTLFRTLSPLGCIQGVPWFSEQEQRVGLFLSPTTNDECATHPHTVQRLVYRKGRACENATRPINPKRGGNMRDKKVSHNE